MLKSFFHLPHPTARKSSNRWALVVYDFLLLVVIQALLVLPYGFGTAKGLLGTALEAVLFAVCLFALRLYGNVYKQIWRYGGIQCYIRLMMADLAAAVVYWAAERLLLGGWLPFDRLLCVCGMNLLGSLVIRMLYRYAYKFSNDRTPLGRFLGKVLTLFIGEDAHQRTAKKIYPVKLAIVGAGTMGVTLAQELAANADTIYQPVCFVDINRRKIGRSIQNLPVFPEDESLFPILHEMGVRDVVFAISNVHSPERKALFEQYLQAGFRIKIYDYPNIQSADRKRQLRSFDIEELLFRKPIELNNAETNRYYRGKVILITGGGGSIGSELSRQVARMEPKQIILLDIYENGVYDVQQELKLAYGQELNLQVEIVSITQKEAMRKVFETYHPHIVIHAAAHKHVPLMEHNCVEAVTNNVFGTNNLVELCQEFTTPRFMMVSTDKAVNPTNVMGATKRMCEMIVQSASTQGNTVYSATRFGNVLGSAGSVIPLFKRQIAKGGPITITDKRIIRYFMTIPEAAQLVLESGAMAKNGELFVLDMGQPVKILELAQNMIRLSGAHGIEIVETGLRPGEKLYEELLVKTEELEKTANNLIFVEREEPLTPRQIARKLNRLQEACDLGDNDWVRQTLHKVVPTYRTPEEVNQQAEKIVQHIG